MNAVDLPMFAHYCGRLVVVVALASLTTCTQADSSVPDSSNDDESGETSSPEGSDAGPDDETLALAQADYDIYCAICHGSEGEGYRADGANALANANFLAGASDQLIYDGIAHGRVDTPMSAWSVNRGGPLTHTAIQRLVALIRSWESIERVDTDAYDGDGVAERGQGVWQALCTDCHGLFGEGGDFLSVASPNFLDHASDGYLAYAVRDGRPGTPMPAFRDILMPREIDDVVALMRSWNFIELPDHDGLDDATLNPDGDDPDFTAPRFVSVDELKAAMDAETKMIILDARPPSDYVERHIKGARSLPFYLASQYAGDLPDDVWIVTYCACPHAESEALADGLIDAGLDRVRVLDEGFNVWLERGYPSESGTG